MVLTIYSINSKLQTRELKMKELGKKYRFQLDTINNCCWFHYLTICNNKALLESDYVRLSNYSIIKQESKKLTLKQANQFIKKYFKYLIEEL